MINLLNTPNKGLLNTFAMKKVIVLTFFLAFILTACEKQEVYDQLYGRWKIIAVSGGMTGSQSIRDFDVVHFSNSGMYSVLFNETIIQTGTYIIEKQNSNKHDYKLILREELNNHPYANFYAFSPFSIDFNKDRTLTLRQIEMSDGFQYDFKRD